MMCRLFDAQVVDELPDSEFSKEPCSRGDPKLRTWQRNHGLLVQRYGRHVQVDHKTAVAVCDAFAEDLGMSAILHDHMGISAQTYSQNELMEMLEVGSQWPAYTYIARVLDKSEDAQINEGAIQFAAGNEFARQRSF